MTIPSDYVDRVYAGVLGKIIGVYLGRPIEGWSYDRIAREIGEVDRYLNDVRGMPLVVTDDDISGTFTFLRAMPDHGNDPNLTPAQIGETWLNYLIERRTILWWGGMGHSTEHTAYLRLKHGVPAPESGSIALNGKTIAEQIGAQIFIDGWGMICPGDPERAADFARRAGSVSHDGEAVHGAQVVAALEAQAFVEADIDRLLDVAVAQIPADSVIARVIHDVREWHAAEPEWRTTRDKIAGSYGYDKFGGACHMVPNHALVVHALLHGGGDFSHSLTIVNSCGWDTDCNSGNVGCILGIRNGLAAIDASPVDWRGPIADRLYLATADGGRAITDAVRETYEVVNIGRSLQGMPPLAPNDGARFHFEAPGSVQGFRAEGEGARIQNIERQGGGGRNLALRYPGGGAVHAVTPTFIPEEAIAMPGYTLLASPTLYPGQEIRAGVAAAPGNSESVDARLLLRVYGPENRLETVEGPSVSLAPGEAQTLTWTAPGTFGAPIAEAGIEAAPAGAASGTLYLDYLTWSGTPDVVFTRQADGGEMWKRAWVDGVDQVDQWPGRWPQPYRIVQNEGTGLISQGTADWRDLRASATVDVPLAKEAGIAVRVGGMRRWYALFLCHDGMARLVKARDGRRTLAEAPLAWDPERAYDLALEAVGPRLRGWVNGDLLFDATDDADPLLAGGIALIVTEGRLMADEVAVRPA